ncbi:class I SAM-dependent methyltransferase [Streptomyces uncialis]|uniref:class I SAM-dependent methyltransferase n=1 Tax=Streptomyces uncialis TaxID=1048205 RepID=UPI00381B7C9A
MFGPGGPTFRELTVQALSSVEHGYDLLAPTFDRTPFRTPDDILDATARVLEGLGPFGRGLDLCCGTGAGTRVLRRVCRDRIVGADLSAGMLTAARPAPPVRPGRPAEHLVRADALALPFAGSLDLVVSFGAFGHFLPRQRPALFAGVHRALAPGGRFAFPVVAPPAPGSRGYWATAGFDAVMRLRNALWRPPFVMYYRTFPLSAVRAELTRAGFTTDLYALPELGRRPDGGPRCRLVVATRPRTRPQVAPGRAADEFSADHRS